MRQIKKEMISVCRRLFQKNLLASCDGNISCKKGEDIFITPSGVPKNSLKIKDIACIDLNGKTKKGSPSSEKLMHTCIYQEVQKAKAIVHAHPPYAVSLSLARPNWKHIPFALSEVALALGKIPIIPYARPGTKEMGKILIPYLKESKAFILSHHGAVTWGESLQEAYLSMERLEHSSQMIYLGESLGGCEELQEKELQELLKIHHSSGNKIL